MLQRIMQGHSHLEGETIERVRLYETFSKIAFLGRRRRVFTRIVTLSGAQPGDRVLDIGCGGGYLARLLGAMRRGSRNGRRHTSTGLRGG